MTARAPGGGMAGFLERLFRDGDVTVQPGQLPPVDEAARHVLISAESVARAELAFTPPGLSLPCAEWAARILYAGCQFTVCRDVEEEEIVRTLRARCPEAPGPEAAWSADLTLRHLPDLFRLARHVSPTDPLIRELRTLSAAWPLSSIGIPGLENIDPSGLMSEPALRQLYVDRVIVRSDVSRLRNPAVAEGVGAAIGAHPDLAPEMARVIEDLRKK